MMTSTEALTVGDIERIAAVLPFPDMIGEEAGWCRDMASTTIVDSFTSVTSTAQNDSSPGAMLRGQQFSISLLKRWSRGAGVQGAQRWFEHPDHRNAPFFGFVRCLDNNDGA